VQAAVIEAPCAVAASISARSSATPSSKSTRSASRPVSSVAAEFRTFGLRHAACPGIAGSYRADQRCFDALLGCRSLTSETRRSHLVTAYRFYALARRRSPHHDRCRAGGFPPEWARIHGSGGRRRRSPLLYRAQA